ncbi:unnamed protein product [Eretmochelys imbricata]
MDRTAVAKMGAVASASVCALVGGVVLAQYLFTMKKKTGRKTKIIEMKSKFACCIHQSCSFSEGQRFCCWCTS